MLGKRVSVAYSEKCGQGKNAVCMIRPENFTISDDGEFTATVRQSIYLGQLVQYEITICGEEFTAVDYMHNVHGVYENGAAVKVSIPIQSLRLLPDSDM